MERYEYEILDGEDTQKGVALQLNLMLPRGYRAAIHISRAFALALGLAAKEKDRWGDTAIKHKAPKSAKVIFEVER